MKPETYLESIATDQPTQWLSQELKVSIETIFELLHIGAIYLEGVRLENLNSTTVGQIFKVYPHPRRFPIEIMSENSILLNDDDFFVIDKPSGIPSIPIASNRLENALHWSKNYLGQYLYPCHRLDEATKGVLVFAKTKLATREFQKDLKSRKTLKLYQCLTDSPVSLGLHQHFLKKTAGKIQVCDDFQGKIAQLEVLSCTEKDEGFLSEIRLLTGRTHQIRCQLSFLGAPIVGDSIYRPSTSEKLQLLSYKLIWRQRCIESRQTLNTFRPQ